MTRKKRIAPEPPCFETSPLPLPPKPRTSSKSRQAPPPPLPKKSLNMQQKKLSFCVSEVPRRHSMIILSNENLIDHETRQKHSKRATKLIRKDDFSDEDDFEATQTVGGQNERQLLSGLESPNGSICTSDSGVNSDIDPTKGRSSNASERRPVNDDGQSPSCSIVSQEDSLESKNSEFIQVVDLDAIGITIKDISLEDSFTPPRAPPPMLDYSPDSPTLSSPRRGSQLDLIQEARRMLRRNQLTPARSPSPTDTIGSCWSDDSPTIFHINEKDDIPTNPIFDDDFAGVRMIGSESCSNTSTSTIRSHRGTIRGVKNRVRAGIATFLRDQRSKNLVERESGKVVVYITTLGIIRETHARCVKVRQILRTLLIRVEEKDLFMSKENQQELSQRTGNPITILPQVFVDGQFLGDAEAIEKLNESGELRQILKPYKSLSVTSVCQKCGGFRMLPCPVCNGSKKSVHRSELLENLVALRCTHCNEAGLIKCEAC